MTDTPERIWVEFDPRDWHGPRIFYGEMRDPCVEFILADLHEAAIRAARIEGYEIARREAASRGLHLVRPELVEVLK